MDRLKRIKENATLDWVEWDEDTVVERVDWLREGDFEWLLKQAEELTALKSRLGVDAKCFEEY